jgi:hypothetical protein
MGVLTYSLTHSLTHLLHAAQSSRSQPVFSFSKNSPNFMVSQDSLLRSQVPATCPYSELCVNISQQHIFYGEELLAPRPTPKLEDHPLSAVRDLFNIYCRPFLHPQLEDAPCRGDRHQLTTGNEGTAPLIFSTLGKGEWPAPRPGRLTPGERTHGTD